MVQVSKSPGATAPGATESPCCVNLEDLLSPQLFKALSDPRRLQLFVRLAGEGCACTVGQLADGSGVDLSVVSRHLAVLRDAGVITCEKRGKEVWCTVRSGEVAGILRDLADALDACCLAGPADEGTAP
jgi:DNA-binding transcriptional ArsR family regulator